MSHLMELTDVNITIKKKKVLKNINLKLEKGKVYGLLGPNGAGKTTLLKSLLGVFRPTSGEIHFQNQNIYSNPSLNIMRKIGSIIEFPGFYGNLTLGENLELHLRYQEIEPTKERIDDLLTYVGLIKEKEKLFSQTSLGMKQRMGIARSISNDPLLLLLDEPTNGLDPQGIKQVRDMLLKQVELNTRTIIVSSHLLNEIDLIADEFIFMKNGEVILTTENTDEINLFTLSLIKPFNEEVKDFFENNGMHIINSESNLIEVITTMKESELIKIISEHVKIKGVTSETISLEDLYLHLLSEGETKHVTN